MNNKICFCSRIQLYNFIIDRFDFLDYKLLLKPVQLHKFINLKIEKKVILENYKNIIELLILEWNCNQRFNVIDISTSKLSNFLSYELTLRHYKFYTFLDNCLNSIFLDKNCMYFKMDKSYLYTSINQIQWNWFSCHFILSNFLFIKKQFSSFSILKVIFFLSVNVYSSNLFFIKSWISINNT